MSTHQFYINRCIQLAELGLQNVAPNPMVGALLVYDNKIIAEGYHQKYGGPHAEVNCINNISTNEQHLIKDCTMYVSLEPCAHYGKTPPCTEFLIQHDIKKVVIGCQDPFSKVNGDGIAQMRAAGIEVVNLDSTAAKELNKRFITFHKHERPYIILKWAQSNDRFIGDLKKRIAISNDVTNVLVHKWRSEEGAIIVGTQTVLSDDPSLTTRLWPGKHPLRIIIDKDLSIPKTVKLFKDGQPLLILNDLKDEVVGNLMYHKVDPGTDYIEETLSLLYRKNVNSLIVEGGSTLLQSFIDKNLWDEARVITNKELLLHEGVSSPLLNSATLLNTIQLGSDEIQFSKRKYLF